MSNSNFPPSLAPVTRHEAALVDGGNAVAVLIAQILASTCIATPTRYGVICTQP